MKFIMWEVEYLAQLKGVWLEERWDSVTVNTMCSTIWRHLKPFLHTLTCKATKYWMKGAAGGSFPGRRSTSSYSRTANIWFLLKLWLHEMCLVKGGLCKVIPIFIYRLCAQDIVSLCLCESNSGEGSCVIVKIYYSWIAHQLSRHRDIVITFAVEVRF